MDFTTLKGYLTHQMKMSHIYQPLMLKELIKAARPVLPSQIAGKFLEYDISQIEYYENIVKNMPSRILRSHGIIKKVGKGYELDMGESSLSNEQKEELIRLCDQKIEEYIAKRGERIWQHRRLGTRIVPGSIRYKVLKQAGFRCSLCGISADERRLEVDHIVPHNLGGADSVDNFQVLCYICNENKSDSDSTNFRDWVKLYEKRKEGCIFCEPKSNNVILDTELAYVFKDNYPVTASHLLVIPKRHVSSFFELFTPEINACMRLLNKFKQEIESQHKTVSGFNVGVNVNESAGQTINHCHIHLIPRRIGDVVNPRGGVRNIIPGKGDYK